MGISDLFADVISSLGFPEAQAEAPAENVDEDSQEAESEEKEEPEEEQGEEEGGDGEEEEEEEEEEKEEEEEAEDIKPQLEEECANSSGCAPYKHHYDECVERVTKMEEDEDYKGPKEDCVEEFFHLTHCATQCAAPKLFKALK